MISFAPLLRLFRAETHKERTDHSKWKQHHEEHWHLESNTDASGLCPADTDGFCLDDTHTPTLK